jgi:acetyl-CoA carboxylase biotin carboxyl carrier protein
MPLFTRSFHGDSRRSSLPGTFYRKPSPEAGFVKDGDPVRIGDVIGLVEVMKMFNEVHADCAGTVVRILVDDESPVEAGQALLLVQG